MYKFLTTNKLFILFIIILFLIVGCCAVSLSLSLFVVGETVLLIMLSSCCRNKVKLLLLPLFFLNIFQIISIVETGQYIEPLMWLNVNHYDSIDVSNYIVSGMIMVLMLLAYFTIKVSVRFKPCLFFVFFIVCELLGAKFFPIYENIRSMKKAYVQYSYRPKYNDGSEFFRKEVVENDSEWTSTDTYRNNVILIFAEGTSLKVISEKVTPNIYNISKKAISFSNYYNHTAATYRGIRGSLISGFQLRGGGYSENGSGIDQFVRRNGEGAFSTESLVSILNDQGYKTFFLSPHEDGIDFNEFIKSIGFSEVFGSGTDETLSDRVLYKNLSEMLSKIEKSKLNQPFFIATYVEGTHLGQDSPDKKYGTGDNEYLNKFYNQDFWFGKFLEKFEESPLSDNTILVFTTDHASFPVPKFMRTFETKSRYFFDEIPLIIYKKNFKRQILDAKRLTSLALTPTILDILGIRDVSNHFLGHSLFEKCERENYEFMHIGGFNGYEVEKDRSFRPVNFYKECLKIKRFYDYAG